MYGLYRKRTGEGILVRDELGKGADCKQKDELYREGQSGINEDHDENPISLQITKWSVSPVDCASKSSFNLTLFVSTGSRGLRVSSQRKLQNWMSITASNHMFIM